ncbi:acid protease [Microthyrium microscopicum]|uniref:Acid protease n=1 Tax=Microthyrium microscopicum TaxID=703497 RepID=A0A6A6U4X0_9PEZI|nr:acid protease [Microthyrium microscopicum]
MATSKLFAFAIAITIVSAATSCHADVAKAISIPITNIQLSNQQTIRGAAVTVGTPPQTLAFIVHADISNTYVFNADTCPTTSHFGVSTTKDYCVSYRGNLFDSTKSSSWSAKSSAKDAGAPNDSSDSVLQKALFGTDTMSLNGSDSLDKFPLAVQSMQWSKDWYYNQHLLGMGPQSTLLTSLKKAGKINSLSWSYWWGDSGAPDQENHDGNLVLGGYDTAKITGDNITFPLAVSDNCTTGMVVPVTALYMKFPQAYPPKVNILDITPQSFCIVPDWPTMFSMTTNMFTTFKSSAKIQQVQEIVSWGPNMYSEVFPGNDTFNGTFIFTLPPNYPIQIPNNQLKIPELVAQESDGKMYYRTDTGNRTILVDRLTGDTKNVVPKIGRQFFSAVVLFVNWDTMTFTLWRAKPTTDSTLIPVASCGSDDSVDINGSGSSSTSSSPGGPGSGSGSGSGSGNGVAETKLSIGAIAGIAVGVFAIAVAIAVILAITCMKKRREAKAQPDVEPSGDLKTEQPGDAKPERSSFYPSPPISPESQHADVAKYQGMDSNMPAELYSPTLMGSRPPTELYRPPPPAPVELHSPPAPAPVELHTDAIHSAAVELPASHTQ